MTARNDITGDVIATGKTTDNFREGWERIFGKKQEPKDEAKETQDDVDTSQDSD